jgi:hypothetical protein
MALQLAATASSTRDETLGVAPQIAVVDTGTRIELGSHHLELLLTRDFLHLGVIGLDRLHGPRRTGELPSGLRPALIEQMRVERPRLWNLELLVPPYVPVRFVGVQSAAQTK